MQRPRSLQGAARYVVWAMGLAAAGFTVYTTWAGVLEPRLQRALHVLLLVPMVFLLYPATRRSPQQRPTFWDWAWALVSAAGAAYIALNHRRLAFRYEGISPVLPVEVVLGGAMALAVLEGARRAVSPWLPLTTLVAVAYLALSRYLPGVLYYKGFPPERIIEMLYLRGAEGIFGFLMGISANLLAIFILFAAFMLHSGLGRYFMDLATLAAGRFRGGPAKVAVLSSALYGSISGSSVADVYATGSFTIPAMKRIGYPPWLAAAIEAVASAGGSLMPPIMGAGAFIMAEMTGIPYSRIAVAAFIPAVLYYIGILWVVHLHAARLGMRPAAPEDVPRLREVLPKAYYLLPLGVVVYYLLAGYSPAKAALYGLVASAGVDFVACGLRPDIRGVAGAVVRAGRSMVQGAQSAAVIAVALACSGIIVVALTQTGLALALSSMILKLSGGHLLLALFLVLAIVSVLGTGIPTTPAYVITATIAAGALHQMGVPTLAVHLFIFYYAVLADVTPPDAVTAFAAAQLAGSDPVVTGFRAPLIAVAGFVTPFLFALRPGLLLQGGPQDVAVDLAVAVTATVALGVAVTGWWTGPVAVWRRLLCAGAGLSAALPGAGALAAAGLLAVALAPDVKSLVLRARQRVVRGSGSPGASSGHVAESARGEFP